MNLRAVLLPVVAAGLIGGVLGTQVAHGGGDFVPVRAADPCLPRAIPQVSTGLDGLAEQLVLVGLDRAACRLDVSREALVFTLGSGGEHTEAVVDAVRAGLRDAVDQLDREGKLPKVSSLTDEILDGVQLNSLVERAIRALPDSLVDNRLPTDELLRRTIDELDIRALLAELTDPSQVQMMITDAVKRAAVDLLISGLNPFD